MHLILVVKTPFRFFWKRSKQEAANSQVQRLMEPIEKKVGFTSSLDKDQWHELFIRLMGRANPYKLVTDYDVVPEARGQQASLQLPYAVVGQQASLRLPHAMVVAMERDSIDRLFRSCEHTAMLASQPL